MRVFRILFFAFLFFSGDLISQATTNHPKILVIYDMEGVSGVSHYEMTWVERPEDYARGRELLTSDVDAAIRGLAAGGAGSIWIQDGHGSGNEKEPDLLVDKLDPHATLIFATGISTLTTRASMAPWTPSYASECTLARTPMATRRIR